MNNFGPDSQTKRSSQSIKCELTREDRLSHPLLDQYREILFSSLISSCGLDALIFRNDEANGHVDTLHNVAQSQKNGNQPVFKKQAHAEAYNARGDYDSAAYHGDKAYIAKGREYNALRDAGLLIDRHTGLQIKPGQKYDRDHVIAAKTLHNDGRSALSGLDPRVLANQDSNLVPTDRAINRSKRDLSPEEYNNYLQRTQQDRSKTVENSRNDMANGTAREGTEKKLHSEEQKLAVKPELMQKNGIIAEKNIKRQHNRAYYTSRDFLGTTSLHALGSGIKMAKRQALGLILMELSLAVHAEIPALLQDWKEAPDWKTKLDPRPFLARLVDALKVAWERIRTKAGPIFRTALAGFGAGVLAEIMTTVINIFTGTARSVMRMLRNFWGGITQSVEIIAFNRENLSSEAQLAAVMRVLSIAVGGMIQPVIAEALNKLMETHGGLIPGFVREVVSQFAGAAVGGIVSVSLVYAIDHSPVVHAIMVMVQKAGALTQEVYRHIAQYAGMAGEVLQSATEKLREFGKSPAVNVAALVLAPPLGVALLAYNRFTALSEDVTKSQESLDRIEAKVVRLEANIQSGLNNITTLVSESNAMLRCVMASQEQQMALLSEIRQEMKDGFDRTRSAIEESAVHTAALVAHRDRQETLNELLTRYRNCAEVLQRGKMPLLQDLAAIEALAGKLISQYEVSFREQSVGAASRFPLLMGMSFALTAWRDARNIKGEDLSACLVEAQRFAKLARDELKGLWSDATFWERTEERSWLISQYAVLHRSLATMPQASAASSTFANDNDILEAPSFDLAGWNDGLDFARDIFEACRHERNETVLKLRTSEQREGWRRLAGLPRLMMVNEIPMDMVRKRLGIPDSVPLGSKAAELIGALPEMIAYNNDLLTSEIG